MQAFVLGGRAVDLVIAVIVIEFIVLVGLRRGDRRRAALDLFFALTPGLFLLLAVRCALTGASWVWVAGAIAASFPFHLADLARRGRVR